MPTYYVTDDLSKPGRPFQARNQQDARKIVQRLSNRAGKELHLYWKKSWVSRLKSRFFPNPAKRLKRDKWKPLPNRAGSIKVERSGAVVYRAPRKRTARRGAKRR